MSDGEDVEGVRRRTVLLVVAGVILALVPLVVPAPPGAGPPIEQDQSDVVRQGWSSPSEGNVTVSVSRAVNNTVHAEFDVEESASEFGLSGARGISWKELDGFVMSSFSGPAWEGSDYSPSANYSYSTESPQATTLGFRRVEYFNKSGWAFVPGIQVSGESAVVRTDWSGTPVGQFIYFGEYEEHSSRIGNQSIRFVSAKGSGFRFEATANTFNDTAAYVNFSPPVSNLPVMILPTRMNTRVGFTAWKSRNSGATVVLSKPTRGMGNIIHRWRSPIVASHEYIHTYQNYWNSKPNAQWVFEASAVYYSLESLYYSGTISDIDYRAAWTRWRGQINNSSVLSNVRTWEKRTPYARGAFVLRGLDKRIRNRTNGSASLQTVLKDVEMHRNPGLSDLNESVRRIAGAETAEWFMQHATTSDLPNVAKKTNGAWWYGGLWATYARIGALPVWIQPLFYLFIGGSLGLAVDGIIARLEGVFQESNEENE